MSLAANGAKEHAEAMSQIRIGCCVDVPLSDCWWGMPGHSEFAGDGDASRWSSFDLRVQREWSTVGAEDAEDAETDRRE